MEGFLMKEGHMNRTWNKRYFVYANNTLSYFEDQTKRNRKGAHSITKASTITKIASTKPNTFKLVAPNAAGGLFKRGNDNLIMSASSNDEMDAWIAFLNKEIQKLNGNAAAEVKITKPDTTVLVLGASGNIGIATVRYLSQYNGKVVTKAGVRDVTSEKNNALLLPGITLVTADMSKPETLPAAMRGVDVVYVVVPGAENRTELALNALAACKEAGVAHVVMLSVASVVRPGSIFADQFIPIEEAVKASGLHYTIVRLPFFMENYLGQLQNMISQGAFYGPIPGDAVHSPVSVNDAGEAVAKILANCSKYDGQTLLFTGDQLSEDGVAAAFAEAMDKPVSYVQVPKTASKKSMVSMGFPEWQADGIGELYQFVEDNELALTGAPSDLPILLGRALTSISDFAVAYAPPPPPKVMVLGASGYLGAATTKHLSSYGEELRVIAGVRDMNNAKSDALRYPGVTLVTADMSKPETLLPVLVGVDAVFIVVPGAENRTELALNALAACKEAGVAHVVMLSVASVVRPGSIFADQFIPIEEAVKASGLHYTIVRLPFFMENYLGQLQNMISQGVFYGPIPGDIAHCPVSVDDAGEAVAKILAEYSDFDGQTLLFHGVPVSENGVAAAFAEAMDKPVSYVQVPHTVSKQSMMSMGFPEWQADGIGELYKLVDAHEACLCGGHKDLFDVLGRPLTTPLDLARANAPSNIMKSESAKAVFAGVSMLKKRGNEGVYHMRFLWVDPDTKKVYWSKKDEKDPSAKFLTLTGKSAVTGPTKTARQRRTSILGSADIDGYLFSVDAGDANEPTLDLKLPSLEMATTWAEVLKAVIQLQ